MSYRQLQKIPFRTEVSPSRSVGPMPRLEFLSIALLVIDDAYQRQITQQGKSNIIRIIEDFDWRKFEPLIVVPTGDGRYAIVDGQHRATAALMHPAVETVPCMVIDATPQDAAACFAAINGAVTAMTLGQMFRARVAAGEHWACSVSALCTRCGVRILAAKAGEESYQPGDTLAVASIEACIKKHGEPAVEAALSAIAQNGNAGLLRADVIKALTLSIVELGIAKADAISAMAAVNLGALLNEARALSAQDRAPAWKHLHRELRWRLQKILDRAQVEEAV